MQTAIFFYISQKKVYLKCLKIKSVDNAYLWLSFFSQDTIWKSSWAAKVPKSNNLPAESNFLACLCKITSMKNSSAEGSFSSFWLEVEAMRALKKKFKSEKIPSNWIQIFMENIFSWNWLVSNLISGNLKFLHTCNY